ncbi:MAG: signal peptidase I [Acidobacteria bacterium]|nr:signal peptidase I [Acidobacteriota bacterium]
MNEQDRFVRKFRAEDEQYSDPERSTPLKADLLPDWRSWIRDLVISLGIAGVVIVFLYQPVKVEGTSMLPRLTDQERIFINKFVYRFEPIHRGDVEVFHYPLDPAKSYIKRIIGLPGETVQMVEGEIFINGRKLTEPYVLPIYRDRQSHGAIVVPHGEFYVLGDHRNSSNDSRLWGTVARKFIYGKAAFVYWPMERLGFVE